MKAGSRAVLGDKTKSSVTSMYSRTLPQLQQFIGLQQAGILVVVVVLLVAGMTLQTVYAGGSGSVSSELLLINDNYHKVQVTTEPGILQGGEEHVMVSLALVNVDTEPGTPVSNVEYSLRIADYDSDTTLVYLDRVYSPVADSLVMLIPVEGEQNISGERYGDDSWLASVDSPVTVEAPVFLEGGLVSMYVTIFSIDGQPVAEDNTFEFSYSMGQFIPFMVEIDGAHTELGFSTYYDRIDEFVYDEQSRSIHAYMPFEWSEDLINSITFVHAEYYIPKTVSLFEDHEILLAVNGIDYIGTVDRSGKDEIVIHYMLSSPKLLELLGQLGPDPPSSMIFELEAGDERLQINKSASLEAGNTVIVPSDDSVYNVHMSVEPAGMIHPDTELVLILEFYSTTSDVGMLNMTTYNLDLMLGEDAILSDAELTTHSDGRGKTMIMFEETGFATVVVSNIDGSDAKAKIRFAVSEPHGMHGGDGDRMHGGDGDRMHGGDGDRMHGGDGDRMHGGDGDSIIESAIEHHVDMVVDSYMPGCERDDSCFNPSTVEIIVGQSVVWTNSDGLAHTVASGTPRMGESGMFSSPVVPSDETYKVTLETAGTFDYYCTLHPWMTGVIIVKETPDMSSHDSMGGHEVSSDISPILPDWLKTSVGWWANGQLDDSTLVSSLEFLINKGFIQIPDTVAPSDATDNGDHATNNDHATNDHNAGPVIPDWLKTNAMWWSEGLVQDSEFVNSLEWLIVNGIIKL